MLREWRLVVGLGVTGLAAFHTLTNLAMHTTTALNAILMLSLVPATILVGGALSGASRPTPGQWAGTAVSLRRRRRPHHARQPRRAARPRPRPRRPLDDRRGAALDRVLAAAAAPAGRPAARRRPDGEHRPGDRRAAAGRRARRRAALPAPTPFVVGAILYIAIFASLIAFSLWAYGVAVIGPERAGQYVHLMPIFGAVLSTLLLGEAVVAAQLVGGAFVFAGLWAVARRGRVRRRACRGAPGEPARACRQAYAAWAAALSAAMSILTIFSIASDTRFALARSGSPIISSSILGTICQLRP